MRSSTSGQIVLFSRLAISGTGTCTDRSNVLAAGGATIVVGACPDRKRATSSGGRTVADSPIRCAGVSSSWSSRSSESARWAPRLVAATACTSSTITVCTAARDSRAADVSMRNSDSGVVIRMSGGLAISSRRRAGGVSPERTPTLISGAGCPRRSAMRVIPVSGVRRLRSTSTASAFSGDTYSTRVPAPAGLGSCRRAGRSPTGTRPASCPDPVGAMTSVLSPSAMADQASRLGGGRRREGAGEPLPGQRAEPGERVLGGAHLRHRANRHRQDHVPRCSGATASVSSAGTPGTRPIMSSSACAHVVGDLAGVDGRIHDALPAHLHRQRQPAVHGDADVAFHLGVEGAAERLVRSGHEPVDLTLVVGVLDAAQDRVGSCPCRHTPPTRRVRCCSS